MLGLTLLMVAAASAAACFPRGGCRLRRDLRAVCSAGWSAFCL